MSFNPLIWKGFDISDKPHQQLFLMQLTDLLNFLNSARGLSTLLNGSSALGASALTVVASNLGLITTNQTVDCSQAASVMAFAQVTSVFSPTITLINFTIGTPISFRFTNGSASAVTLKLAASTPGGSAITVTAYSTTAATVMNTTGLSVPAGQNAMFSGASFSLNIDLVVNVT